MRVGEEYGLRESTHIVFGMGATALAGRLLGCHPACLWMGIAVNVVMHWLIDVLGHEHLWNRRGRRHALTHSLLGASLLALALFAATDRAAMALGLDLGGTMLAWLFLAAAWSHLLLDALNPSGVFVCGKRVSLRVARYNDPVANLALQILGVALLALALGVMG